MYILKVTDKDCSLLSAFIKKFLNRCAHSRSLTKTDFFLLRKLLAQLLKKGEVWRDGGKISCFFLLLIKQQ